MNISVIKGDILETPTELLVVGVYEGEPLENPFTERLNMLLKGRLPKLAAIQQFSGASGQSMLFPAPDHLEAEYVLVVGLGTSAGNALQETREVTATALQTAKRLGLHHVALEFFGEDEDGFRAKEAGAVMAEALLLADYTFSLYKKNEGAEIKEVVIVAEDGRDAQKARVGIERGMLLADGVIVARDLVNTPAKDMTPTRLAEAAEEIAHAAGPNIRVKILDQEACERKQMFSFLGVAQGSDEAPKFIHLTYKPDGSAKKRIAVIGKGITFDSGGLSIKPAGYMESMKCDMAGGAAVLGLFSILAELKPNIEVHGIIAAAENMPSAKAIRPGDILRASNGKTIEVLNTDAEGRLTLADALVYAEKLGPDVMIDLATLTGACVVGLGEEIAGLMSNTPILAQALLTAGAETGEKLWELPLEPSYNALIKSHVADMTNVSKSHYGGAITAGIFLAEFVSRDQPWAHIDIAGPAFIERSLNASTQVGATGFGVRTLARYIDSL